MNHISYMNMAPSYVADDKPLICECCGGKINRRTMKCEYCDTNYKNDQMVAGVIEYRRPREEHLTTTFSIDRRALREEGAPLLEYCLNQMAGKMAEQLMPFCEFDSMYDHDIDRIRIAARLKVVAPCEPGDIQIRRMFDEGLY